MRDRDKLLIIVVLIAGIVLLPYFFYIKDTKEKTVNVNNQVAQLEERYQYLLDLEQHREEYEAETAFFNQDIIDIVNTFPTGISNENLVMFLKNTEYARYTEVEDEETSKKYQYPGTRINTGSFGIPVQNALENEDYSTGYESLTMTTEFSYICRTYEDCKYILNYLNAYKDPLSYDSITFEFDPDSGNIEGTCVFTEYAVIGGEDRTDFVPLPIEPDLDKLKLRGNEEYGVFGPTTQVAKDVEFEAVTGEKPEHLKTDEDAEDEDTEDED